MWDSQNNVPCFIWDSCPLSIPTEHPFTNTTGRGMHWLLAILWLTMKLFNQKGILTQNILSDSIRLIAWMTCSFFTVKPSWVQLKSTVQLRAMCPLKTGNYLFQALDNSETRPNKKAYIMYTIITKANANTGSWVNLPLRPEGNFTWDYIIAVLFNNFIKPIWVFISIEAGCHFHKAILCPASKKWLSSKTKTDKTEGFGSIVKWKFTTGARLFKANYLCRFLEVCTVDLW